MDNVNQPAAGGSKTGMWVALVIAVIVLGVGAYFLFASEKNGANTNAAVYENVNDTTNVNTVVNTNVGSNSNELANTNTDIDTSNWLTYTNSEYGYTMRYPSDWTVEEINDYDTVAYDNVPARSVNFSTPENNFFRVRIMRQGDEGTLGYIGGIGANDSRDDEPITIENIEIVSKRLLYDGKYQMWMILQQEISEYLFGADFGIVENNNLRVLDDSTELQQAKQILLTLDLP